MIKRIYIEITNVCNLKCSFCSEIKRAPKHMTLTEIKSILTQCKDITDYVYLHVKGEPLVHPNFIEIMDLMQTYNMKVQLVTNGTFIKNYFCLLNYSCLRKISFSLHSVPFQPEKLDEYIKPIIEFVKLASKQNTPYCELRFWNQNNLDDLSKECLQIIQKQFINHHATNHNNFELSPHVYLNFDKQFEWPKNSNNTNQFGSCYGAKRMIAILSNGTVVPCCLDDEGEINLGNIFKTPLQDILKSSRYLNMLEQFNDKCTEKLCQNCTYRNRFIK